MAQTLTRAPVGGITGAEINEKEKEHAPQADRQRVSAPDQDDVDFGEDGIPLERFGEITKLLKGRHLGAVPKVKPGFVHISFSFDRYVELHVQSNPSVDRVEFAHRLRQTVDARKAGARCACGGELPVSYRA